MKFTKIFKLLLTIIVRLLIQKMLGIVTGALQHKDTKKCVNFGEMSNPPYGTCSTHRGAFIWCIDHLMKLDTSNCATVSLETNGRIKESGWCVHMYQERDVFKSPCGTWPRDPHFENVITFSVQPNGEILINNVGYCLTIQTGNKLRALSNSNAACRESRSRFRVVG
ncbi:uncharacterized protein LOC110066118 [Orbicella faveolata]|uniref:uncharacterized protein LOC110066118 n=1 Tax=Orbicella faveolata TaxID=48498 RepID=UPI0009E3A2C6|nr:uncharacterized protein LOC110066118 [Orbicella faveolata]